ncbi:MAG: hypothetical protein IPK29_15305 [Betaproteobacteria bacterium]|nr:hypothetical protein [Betaproteobacteria bacterium]
MKTTEAGKGNPRLACAVDRDLVDALHQVSGVTSIQPYLMSALNAQRHRFSEGTSWFVLEEHGRHTIALILEGSLKLVRTRAVRDEDNLPELIEKEARLAGLSVKAGPIFRHSELALVPGMPIDLRTYAMAMG